jgi:hypothetical protein
MTRIRLFLATMLLIALPAAAATVSGTVRQAENSSTLAGITVVAYDAATGVAAANATSDSFGHYSLTLAAGSYRLLAFDQSGTYATSFYKDAAAFEAAATVTLQSSETVTADFTMLRGSYIAGNVTTASGAPVAGATVAIYNLTGSRRGTTVTDAAGHYLVVVPAGSYKVAAWDDDLRYAPTFHANASTFPAATVVATRVSETTPINIVLALAAHIRGAVKDLQTSSPLANAVVVAYDLSGNVAGATVTSSNGAYDLVLRPGSYKIVFEDLSGVYASSFYSNAESFETSTVVTVAEGATRESVNGTLARGATLEGVVRDAVSSAPLANMVVVAYNASGTARVFAITGTDGRYSLLVPSGDFKVAAFDPALNYATIFYPGSPSFASAFTVRAIAPQRTSGLDLALARGGQIAGRVTTSGTPLAGITVAAYDANGTLIASSDTNGGGGYRLVLAPGTYTVAAFDRALRFVTAPAVTVTIVAGDGQTRDFDVVAGDAIRAVVMTAALPSRPLEGILLGVYNSSGTQIASAETNANGEAAVAVPSGTYRLVASDPQQRFLASYYNGADSFETAESVTVEHSDVSVQFRLTQSASSRRRRVEH